MSDGQAPIRVITTSRACDRCQQVAPPLKHVYLEVGEMVVMDEIVCIPCMEVCDDALAQAYPTSRREWTLTMVDAEVIAERLRLRPNVNVLIERPETTKVELAMRSDRLTDEQWGIVDAFHTLTFGATPKWLGIPILKTPLDLFIYQEILYEQQPDLLIECGTAWGGSALFFASIMDLIGHGHVITIDLVTDIPRIYEWAFGYNNDAPYPTERPQHPRITYISGDTVSPRIVTDVHRRAKGKRTMVVLDSGHDANHVLDECMAYADLVTPDGYLVIEDVNLNGHPIETPRISPGPYEATILFLTKHQDFKWNISWTDRYFMTQHAYLRRISMKGRVNGHAPEASAQANVAGDSTPKRHQRARTTLA